MAWLVVMAECLEVRPGAEVGDQHDCQYDARNQRADNRDDSSTGAGGMSVVLDAAAAPGEKDLLYVRQMSEKMQGHEGGPYDEAHLVQQAQRAGGLRSDKQQRDPSGEYRDTCSHDDRGAQTQQNGRSTALAIDGV
jgi:hypothetical protein